jgi:hypothetical protein
LSRSIHPPRPRGLRHATAQNGAAEYDAARRKHRPSVVEDDALGGDVAGQAVQQPVQPDGLERACGQPERLKRVRLMRLGPVAVKALGGDMERGGVQIHQRDVWRLRRVAALVEQVASSDADVEMAARDVLVIEPNETPRRAAPREVPVQPQNNRVVDPQEAGCIARLSGIRRVVGRDSRRDWATIASA